MQVSNLMKIIVSAIIGVVVFAAILVPVTQEAVTTEKTFTNEGGFYPMQEISSTDEGTYTLEWVKSDTTVLTINGVDFDAYESYGEATTTIICSESWLLRYYCTTQTYGYLQFFDGTNWIGSATSKSVSVSATSGTATITHVAADDTETTRTASYTDLYVINPSATDDIMKKSTDTPYVNGDSALYAMGITSISGSNSLVKIEGNIDDGVTVDVLGTTSETVTNIVIDKEAVSGYLDLYKITKITFDVEISDTTTACTYSYFIVPYEVTAELSAHPGTSEIALINIIPLLVLVGLVLGVVGAVLSRRD